MTALDHIKRYPNARTSTLAHLIAKERTNENLIGFVIQRECVKALESELSKLLPDYARRDIERVEETF